MESIIIYIVIAIVAIVNFVRNYQKEQRKHRERSKDILAQPMPVPVNRPFQNNKEVIPTKTNYDSFENYNDQKSEKENIYQSQTTISQNDNFYNSKGIEAILAKIENSSNTDEKEAFFIETNLSSVSETENLNSTSYDLKLKSADDYRRAFVHSLIFNRKY